MPVNYGNWGSTGRYGTTKPLPKKLPKIDPKTGKEVVAKPPKDVVNITLPMEETMAKQSKPLTPRPALWNAAGTPNSAPAGGIMPRPTVTPPPLTPLVQQPGGGSDAVAAGARIAAARGTDASVAGPVATKTVNTGSSGATGDVSDAATGFAKAFKGDMLPYVYAQPELILRELMRQQGLDPTGRNAGLYTAATPYMDALNAILPLAFGATGPAGPSSAVNWLASMAQQGMTPGGRTINFQDVMDRLGAINMGRADNGDVLAGMLGATGMDPLDQINAVKQIVLGAAQGGLPPQYQRAVQNMLNAAAVNYMGNVVGGNGDPGAFLTQLMKTGGIFGG